MAILENNKTFEVGDMFDSMSKKPLKFIWTFLLKVIPVSVVYTHSNIKIATLTAVDTTVKDINMGSLKMSF